jgi:beta-lactamase class D
MLLTLLPSLGCAKSGAVATRRAEPHESTERANTNAAPSPTPQKSVAPAADLSVYFKEHPGAFVLYDLKNDRYLRHNEARCRERFTPFSTFKIPNSLIGLESGVIRDADFLIKWDSKKYPRFGDTMPFISWWQDQTLRTALKRSVVWYYQELATRVGAEKMKAYVNQLGYGNRDTSGGVTRFWLNSTLKISADEQVEFLKALYKEELPFSQRSVRIVKEILTLEETPDYKLSAKTGGGSLGENRALGWFVGYLETKENVYFFATQLEGPNYLSIRDKRIDITKRILKDLGYMK